MVADETEDVYHPRVQRNITNLMTKHQTLSWDLRARDFYFKWAGQVAKMIRAEPNRPTTMALRFHNIRSIRQYADTHGGKSNLQQTFLIGLLCIRTSSDTRG